jgi:hypothetical protein
MDAFRPSGGFGTVFKMAPEGTVITLHAFINGGNPVAAARPQNPSDGSRASASGRLKLDQAPDRGVRGVGGR